MQWMRGGLCSRESARVPSVERSGRRRSVSSERQRQRLAKFPQFDPVFPQFEPAWLQSRIDPRPTDSCARHRLEAFEESPRDKLLNFPQPFDSLAMDDQRR